MVRIHPPQQTPMKSDRAAERAGDRTASAARRRSARASRSGRSRFGSRRPNSRRIRVNAIAPGLILDEVLREGDPAHRSKYADMMLAMTPLRRTGAPEDIAPAVVFLASDRSPWTTGSILEITGGSHCGRPHVPLSRELR